MASLVAEILSSAGKLDKEDLHKKVLNLAKNVDDIKLRISEIIETQYKEFLPSVANTKTLVDEVTKMKDEAQMLSMKIDEEIKGQLNSATTEMQDLQKQLKESTLLTNLLYQLSDIHNNLEAVDKHFIDNNYLGAAKAIANVKNSLMNLSHDSNDSIDMLQSIRTEYLVKREKLIYNLSEIWNRHLVWNFTPSHISKTKNNFKFVEFKLVLTGEESISQINNLMNAMLALSQLKVKLKLFGEQFMKHIIEPIVTSPVSIKETEQPHSVAISLTFAEKCEEKPFPVEVIDNMIKIFKFMYNSFLAMKINTANETSDEKIPLMKTLGDIISEQFCDYIIKNCFMEAIPNSSKILENYVPIIEASQKFQELLITQEFLQPDNEAMVNFTRNVNVLFVNKICKDILGRARNLMKRELYSTVIIDPNTEKYSNLLKLDGKDKDFKPLEPEHKLSNVFTFPKCEISIMSKEILALVDEVLVEASISSTVCAARLFYTSRNIFELYCDVIPTYHKESLSSLPHISAIHYNNCMFLANHLQTLGHRYKPRLPESMNAANITYVDLIFRLRKLGTDVFLNQMLTQKKILLECLKEAQGFQNIALDQSFSPQAEKSIKQCIHQLQSLKKVWSNVLPINVYFKSMGTLINSWLESIIFGIASQEDISADSASQLIALFGLISEQTPYIFEVSKLYEKSAEVFKHVSNWSKFQELIVVLGASMQELLDRWAAGKGPLADAFNAEEVKQLIRALFQNTDRRAAVLAKIK
ncbi:Centromere/kinetochore protein zw10 [Nymphon striatum]|nr:Centromere/kinetochore protein zw10 [Nymphon striatum]